MNTNAGVWIDHREAMIVFVSKQGLETKKIASNVEKQLGRFEGARSTQPQEAQRIPTENSQKRDFMNSLQQYYDRVFKEIVNVEGVLIFGPGAAKNEFKKRIEKNWSQDRLLVLETADKMTDNQIAAKVREFFRKPAAAAIPAK
jgi:stalled ribosome rescue protein Dom34